MSQGEYVRVPLLEVVQALFGKAILSRRELTLCMALVVLVPHVCFNWLEKFRFLVGGPHVDKRYNPVF